MFGEAKVRIFDDCALFVALICQDWSLDPHALRLISFASCALFVALICLTLALKGQKRYYTPR